MKKKCGIYRISVFEAFIFLSVLLITGDLYAVNSSTAYRTYFGRCPSRSVGALSLRLVKIFEDSRSLRSVKQEILQEKLDKKYFISKYKISFDPLKNFLVLNFECPEPLMKVQVYKNDGADSYNAILVDTGELYDSVYELLMRNEKKLTKELPYLALPVGEMDQSLQYEVAKIIRDMESSAKESLSEVILNDSKELTIIMSHKGRPTSVFMGSAMWTEKISKLQKILKYMKEKDRVPSIINLTNTKKVVVKFSDNF